MPQRPHTPRRTSSVPRLGPLETEVLEHLFDTGPQDVVGMRELARTPRARSKNTIHSTLERLVRKRLATREKRGRSFVYRAAVSRGEWMARQLAELIPEAQGEDTTTLLATFVDVAERAGEDHLARLERLVRARRRALDADPTSEDRS